MDNYRAIVGDGALSLDEQEAILKYKLKKTKEAQTVQKEGEKNFFVMMDARINKVSIRRDLIRILLSTKMP